MNEEPLTPFQHVRQGVRGFDSGSTQSQKEQRMKHLTTSSRIV